MAVLAGNISLRTSIQLQRRALISHLMKSSCMITCSKREYSTSGPVRYIPKKSRAKRTSENPQPLKNPDRNDADYKIKDIDVWKVAIEQEHVEQRSTLPGRKSESRPFRKDLERNASDCSDISGLRSALEHENVVQRRTSFNRQLDNHWTLKDSDRNDFVDTADFGAQSITDERKHGSISFNSRSENHLSLGNSNENDFPDHMDLSSRRFPVEDESDIQGSICLDNKLGNQYQLQNNNDHSSNDSEQELEGEYNFHLEFDDNDLIINPKKSKEELDIGSNSKQKAESLAVESLSRRAFTAVELKKKLHGKRFSSDVVEAVITEFQERGLINDGLYAEAYSRSRWSSYTWGPRRIKQALLKKGIRQVDAERAVKLVFDDNEDESSVGMSKDSMDLLFSKASKQWLRSQDAPRETRKSRVIRWLQYRGFKWDVIKVVLKRLESRYPP